MTRANKPTLVEGVTRTLQAYDILREQMMARNTGDEPRVGDLSPDAFATLIENSRLRLLEIADRIAARTSDE